MQLQRTKALMFPTEGQLTTVGRCRPRNLPNRDFPKGHQTGTTAPGTPSGHPSPPPAHRGAGWGGKDRGDPRQDGGVGGVGGEGGGPRSPPPSPTQHGPGTRLDTVEVRPSSSRVFNARSAVPIDRANMANRPITLLVTAELVVLSLFSILGVAPFGAKRKRPQRRLQGDPP